MLILSENNTQYACTGIKCLFNDVPIATTFNQTERQTDGQSAKQLLRPTYGPIHNDYLLIYLMTSCCGFDGLIALFILKYNRSGSGGLLFKLK